MKLRGSHLVALAILAGIGGWMFTGDIIQGGQVDPDAQSIAEREEARSDDAFRVQVAAMQPDEREATLDIRGRTMASASVSVRAETGGTVLAREVRKGQLVAAGDLLCTLDEGVRGTSLAQAEAALQQAQADFDSNQRLAEQGFTTQSRMRQLRTALDSASAALAGAKQDMTRTQVRTTIAGQITEPLAEPGDNLTPGGVCATVVQTDPIKFTGQVSETEIGNVRTGMDANVMLVSGEQSAGTVSFIAPTADERTRTFAVEIDLPNPDRAIREGITASAAIPLDTSEAYKVLPSWLTLADDGQVGVRVVMNDDTVAFKAVTILAQEEQSMWVAGLAPGDRVITLGQDFVAAGQKVEPVVAPDAQQTNAPDEAAKSAALTTSAQD